MNDRYWLIIYCFPSRSGIFHFLTIADERLQILTPGSGHRHLFLSVCFDNGIQVSKHIYRNKCLWLWVFEQRGGGVSSTPAVTRGLVFFFFGLIRKTAPFSRLLRRTRVCGGYTLTRTLTAIKNTLFAAICLDCSTTTWEIWFSFYCWF
jgi:hypothetical protein